MHRLQLQLHVHSAKREYQIPCVYHLTVFALFTNIPSNTCHALPHCTGTFPDHDHHLKAADAVHLLWSHSLSHAASCLPAIGSKSHNTSEHEALLCRTASSLSTKAFHRWIRLSCMLLLHAGSGPGCFRLSSANGIIKGRTTLVRMLCMR